MAGSVTKRCINFSRLPFGSENIRREEIIQTYGEGKEREQYLPNKKSDENKLPKEKNTRVLSQKAEKRSPKENKSKPEVKGVRCH